MMVDPMFRIVTNLVFFVIAVTPTAVAPTAFFLRRNFDEFGPIGPF